MAKCYGKAGEGAIQMGKRRGKRLIVVASAFVILSIVLNFLSLQITSSSYFAGLIRVLLFANSLGLLATVFAPLIDDSISQPVRHAFKGAKAEQVVAELLQGRAMNMLFSMMLALKIET